MSLKFKDLNVGKSYTAIRRNGQPVEFEVLCFREVRAIVKVRNGTYELFGPEYTNNELDSIYLIEKPKQQPKPRTKTEYEHLTESNFDVWDLKTLLENGELFSKCSNGTYDMYSANASMYMLNHFSEYGVFRKVEKPIEWWEDAADYLGKYESVKMIPRENGWLSISINGSELSMTRDQWCDFARILLEQSE